MIVRSWPGGSSLRARASITVVACVARYAMTTGQLDHGFVGLGAHSAWLYAAAVWSLLVWATSVLRARYWLRSE